MGEIRSVGFRLSKEKAVRAEKIARACRQGMNQWCREQIEKLIDLSCGLSPGERLLLSEVGLLRAAVLDGFKLVAAGALDEESLAEVLDLNDQKREEAVRHYFRQLGWPDQSEEEGDHPQFSNRR